MPQVAISLLVDLAALVTLGALVVRGRWRSCPPFVAYLAFVFTAHLLFLLGPPPSEPRWILQDGLARALVAGTTLDLAFRALRNPGRRRPGRPLLAAVAVVATAGASFGGTLWLVAEPAHLDTVGDALGEVWSVLRDRRLLMFWAMAAVLALGWWRRSLESFQAGLLSGFVLYWAVFALLPVVFFAGRPVPLAFREGDRAAFVGLVWWWAYLAGRDV
jgi:hypothetical protein